MHIHHVRTALLSVLVATSAAAAQTAKPLVMVVGTGGTIGSAGDYWGGNSTYIPIAELVRTAGIDSVATVESEQFLNVPSSAIGPVQWLELSRHISDVFRSRPRVRGIVVTHGTDTMEETAYFLDLTVAGERPVVVTGSMRPSNMVGADGPANLTNAIRAAVDTAARGRGTMVLMDDRLYSARDVTKTNSTRVETFQAPERGPIAIVDPEGAFYRSRSAGRSIPQFDIRGVKDLPRVDIIYSYAGADSVAIDAVVAAGAKGIVIAGVGRGGMTSSQSDAARRAADKGVIVVTSTRTGSGRVPVGTKGDSIGSGDLNPQKARVLLALALTRTSNPAEIRKIFNENQ
ncbi:MAG: L-asparaginase 2 [Gemmatimonadetes bacterium]|nr:L-asparaginase 2 [Gemmatimonadota bacterium]